MKNLHFLSSNLKKPIFHKNLNVYFFNYLDTCARNTLLVDNTPYKSLFNEPLNVIFIETFKSFDIDDNYMLGVFFPYLEVL